LSAAGIVLGGLLLLVSPVAVADPWVTGVVASDSLVSDADTSGLFTVTVDFDVAMNTSTSPTLIFAPDVSSTLVLLPGGSWADSDTYIATYSVSDANADVNSVTIDVTGAWDLAGRPQQDYTPVHEFEIDTRNPSAPVVTGIATDAGSSNEDAVTNDSTLILSGIAESQSSVRLYRDGSLMGGPVVAQGTGAWTFDYQGTVVPDGTYRFTATATDLAGNVSPESAPLTVLVDTQGAPAPEGRTPSDGTRTNDTTPTFSWTAVAADPGGSGVRDYGYSVLGPTPKSGTTTGTTYTPSSSSPLRDGDYTWKLRTRDVAGNLGAYGSSWSLVIDTVSPTVTIVASDLAICDGDVGRFTVTATFSEAMNPAVVPTLMLTPNPTTTFTNPSGAWNVPNTVYMWTYDVVDAGVTVPDVDVGVSGGQDVAGNAQVSSTNTDYVDIDTQNPTVTSIVASDLRIGDGDAGSPFTVTVGFSEAMSSIAAPTLVFCPAVATTLAFASGTWVDVDTYQVVYSVADANVDQDSVAIEVINAEDAAGNVQQDYVAAHEFEIDTANPSVSTVAAGTALVYDAELTQPIAVTFSEAMNIGLAPTITFSAGTWTGGVAGTWTVGNTMWTRTFMLTDNQETAASVTVGVSGAEDSAGNGQRLYAVRPEFRIDTQNPTVTIVASDLAICDGDVGRFTVTATFSEAMNPGVAPSVAFSPDLTQIPATFTSGNGVWGGTGGSTAYTWTYDVVDAGVSVPDVDVTVAGGRDVAGNLQISSTNTDYVDIDTRNPELVPGASAVAVDTDPVYEGDLTQRVTVTFDEAMMTDGSVNPTITFDRGTWGANGDGVWNSPTDTVWTETFTLVDNDEEFYERTTGVFVVAVTASNARDAAGNLQEPYAAEPEFDIDTLQPEITEFTSVPDGGCHVAGDTIDITVAFSESVFGALTLNLDSGAIVDVLGVTSSDSETRTYAIQWGENSCDLDVESAVVDAGGGLVDWAGNRAHWTGNETSLSLPTSRNLADNGAVIVDTTLPIAVTDPNEDEMRSGGDSDIVEVRLDLQGRYRLIVRQDTPVYIDLLANDTELPCLRYLSVYDFPVLPTYGTLPDENPANPVRYAPYAGCIGPDEFTYRAVDACGNVSVEATVCVEVIPQLVFADVCVTVCAESSVAIDVAATDLFVPPGAPEDAEFAFEIVEGPEHGIVAGDPAEVETKGPGLSTLFIESATVKFIYAPASGFVGRDQFRVRVSDPFGVATTAVIDIEIQDCSWVAESPLVIPQGALLPLIVPVSFFANVYETAWDTVTLTGEDGTEHPEAVLAAWSESLGRPTLVVDTGPLTLGAYELVVPLGNGEIVTLRFAVGEKP
jgi:hypothetical protein